MRINVYAEELTRETTFVSKTASVGGENRTFYGVRFFLKSPEELHNTPLDDDRSAITLWIPWTKDGGHDFMFLQTLLADLAFQTSQAAIDAADRAR